MRAMSAAVGFTVGRGVGSTVGRYGVQDVRDATAMVARADVVAASLRAVGGACLRWCVLDLFCGGLMAGHQCGTLVSRRRDAWAA